MPIKYFCDECGVEVSDPSGSLDMTGKILCSKHFQEHQENYKSFHSEYIKKWDDNRFMTDCKHIWVIVMFTPFTQRCTKCGLER